MQLVTIPFSHYCEKARWGLEHFGVPYVERRFMPMFHFPGVMWATRLRGGKPEGTSTRWSTPLLIDPDGAHVHDSSQIVRYLSERFGDEQTTLYPEAHREPIEQVERWLSRSIGPHTRRVFYFYAMQDTRWFADLARFNVGRLQAALYVACAPVIRAMLRKALRIDRRHAERSLSAIDEVLEALDERLGDRPYLVGDRFTAADLTAACLLVPVVVPVEGYGAWIEAPTLPEEYAAVVEKVRATRVGRYLRRMFAEERRRCPAP